MLRIEKGGGRELRQDGVGKGEGRGKRWNEGDGGEKESTDTKIRRRIGMEARELKLISCFRPPKNDV